MMVRDILDSAKVEMLTQRVRGFHIRVPMFSMGKMSELLLYFCEAEMLMLILISDIQHFDRFTYVGVLLAGTSQETQEMLSSL